ncbi:MULTISPECIES: NAD(P)/FAD-dependent oxidoreductase [unclassified Leptolyngbya]|uniref:NAD(P)/FAD-dependent oxidoreductase n=1 Tax=unclassified Leptolyngbya TaxID=2650499 RepID=UPI001686ED35|nr:MULTISPECIES: NAD(P)/FAD-dependent oxidoreductase [unclassified Leptolyngbya]MBD1913105.1 NAD(P)/FAD-dependent oxidoreductase [Leptolyngbya sp. FACHB-8]MBD2153241.1 NAD(P)/FAD-dependent oxidoreductase [Leptolyngbya sp. FACHB-16]
MTHPSTVIIGAGPAGLTSAYELAKNGHSTVVLEQGDRVGGISRTETYNGYRFDIGGHRFYTKVKEVEQLWEEVLGDEMISVPRLSRIYYDGVFFNYPLEPKDALLKLGFWNSLAIVLSYLKSRVSPLPQEEDLESWVINRFGERLYHTFFKTYTEKVWGIPCDQIRADWAAQRIRGLSLKKAITDAFFGSTDTKTLIKSFVYPRLGPGMMWERFQTLLEQKGNPVHLNTGVVRIEREGFRITRVVAEQNGSPVTFEGNHFVSSMPVSKLLQYMNPAPPEEVMHAARSLKYRDFLIVALMVDAPDLFPDNWIYIHSPKFQVGRIQNFKNWSPEMVPDSSKTCLGMEYFCSQGDALWETSDADLIKLASQEARGLGLVQPSMAIEDGTVIRQRKAYPVYDAEYRQHLQVIQDYIECFENLQTVGRNGMHRYNNQDHSMLTGLLAARNIIGEQHPLWDVNTERSYYEEFERSKAEVAVPVGAQQLQYS